MAHKEVLKESCDRIWKLLDRLNGSAAPAGQEAKDAEQYHQLLSALADSYGIKMAMDAEEEQENGAAYRNAPYNPGGWSGHWDPYLHGGAYRNRTYRRGGSYHDGLAARLEDLMEQAPAGDRRHFDKVLEYVDRNA